MKVEVQVEGKQQTVDVAVDRLTLSESVTVQKLVGNEEWDQLASGNVRPVALQAIVFAKIRKQFPGVGIDDFDFDFSEELDEVDPTETG